MEGPGFLAVTIQPGPETDLNAFHEWYNTEHGPLRLRLPFIENGARYSEIDGKKPEWSAVYDVTDLAWLEKNIYTRLRQERSAREKAVMATFKSLDRKIYSLFASHGADQGPPAITVSVSWHIKESELEDFNRFYDEEHTDLLSKVPGWIRSRRFRMVAGGIHGMPPEGVIEVLAVHDYESADAFSGPEAKALATPRTQEWLDRAIWHERRHWKRYHTFTPLVEPPSSVITTDGAVLRYQLEGNPADPVIVCINSILTSMEIWDDVTRALLAGINGKTYQVLRYNSRGYAQQDAKSNPTSFDILADDLDYLLQRVGVSRAHAVLGVSMGGVTALNFAIRHPQQLDRFVACDCNVGASAANSQAWAERVRLAQAQGMDALATATVERWFTPPNAHAEQALRVRLMAAAADFEGFRLNSLALSHYDLRPRLAEIKAPGLLVAGEGDGKIPEAMQKFGIPGTTFISIPGAGHLPFLENFKAFVDALAGFL